MIERYCRSQIQEDLARNSAVALVGPRQVGKTTLALELAAGMDSAYIDLELPSDSQKLDDPEFYFSQHKGQLMVIDEVQRKPELFRILRSQIDRNRRTGYRNAQFLLLGSASNELLNQTSESLAGRISYRELHPFNLLEVGSDKWIDLWIKGGFPDSFLGQHSVKWRRDFIRTYLERDIPMLGSRVPAETLRRFWSMLCHSQGQLFNASRLGSSLGVSGQSISRYLDLMVDLMLVHRLQPWHSNTKKRLVKSPKIYIRDSGLLHAILNISSMDDLLGHPILGASFEGFVIDNIRSVLPGHVETCFYRTAAGAEIDLVLRVNGELWAIEIKHSTIPKLTKGFHLACQDILPARKYIVYSGKETYKTKEGVIVVSLTQMLNKLTEFSDGAS
ncbi:MAG: ATPase [Acidobacteria bacterium]|nr:MAG: ATPase [Acidobacteriota bacterium]PIE90942.1 MAG: ATPase [Acidobacteriota bacterium]